MSKCHDIIYGHRWPIDVSSLHLVDRWPNHVRGATPWAKRRKAQQLGPEDTTQPTGDPQRGSKTSSVLDGFGRCRQLDQLDREFETRSGNRNMLQRSLESCCQGWTWISVPGYFCIFLLPMIVTCVPSVPLRPRPAGSQNEWPGANSWTACAAGSRIRRRWDGWDAATAQCSKALG